MSNPKTIYIDDEQSIESPAGLWTDHRELLSDKEYRLVGECVWKTTIYNSELYDANCGELSLKPRGDFCSCGDRIKIK